jgi:hypothetical protein
MMGKRTSAREPAEEKKPTPRVAYMLDRWSSTPKPVPVTILKETASTYTYENPKEHYTKGGRRCLKTSETFYDTEQDAIDSVVLRARKNVRALKRRLAERREEMEEIRKLYPTSAAWTAPLDKED